jgi:hypothetical protein
MILVGSWMCTIRQKDVCHRFNSAWGIDKDQIAGSVFPPNVAGVFPSASSKVDTILLLRHAVFDLESYCTLRSSHRR